MQLEFGFNSRPEEHKYTHEKSMSHYELRFEIFKQANKLAQDQYNAEFAFAEMWNKDRSKTVKIDFPNFPTYEYIEELATKINDFVDSK